MSSFFDGLITTFFFSKKAEVIYNLAYTIVYLKKYSQIFQSIRAKDAILSSIAF